MKNNNRKEDLKKLLLKDSVGSYGRIYQLIQTLLNALVKINKILLKAQYLTFYLINGNIK